MYIHVYISVCTGVHDLHLYHACMWSTAQLLCVHVCSKFCMPAV